MGSARGAMLAAAIAAWALVAGCGQPAAPGSGAAAGSELPTFEVDGKTGGDGADSATGADGGAGDVDAASGQDTAQDVATADIGPGPDGVADGVADADLDAAAAEVANGVDAAIDVQASDAAPDVAPDAVEEVAQETSQGDAGDAGVDAAPEAGIDAGPAVCAPGQLQRCWVECTQIYQAGCIHGDVPPRIPGVRACTGGQWAACVTPQSCKELVGTCDNGAKKPLTVTCLDGSQKQGVHHCLKPLGANCAFSYWAGYGALDCPDLCTTAADQCPMAGASEPCEALCDVPDGLKVPGTRTCQAVCNAQVWSTCMTGDGCWKAAGSPGQ